MRWKQTDVAVPIHRYDLPPLHELRVLDMTDVRIELIRAGDFDGHIYLGMASWRNDRSADLDWLRCTGELVEETVAITSDYADSAE